MVRHRTLALLAVALELGLACGQGPAASSGFTSGPHPITLTGSASGEASSGSSGGSGSSGSSGVEDSTVGSASGMSSTGSTSVMDMGVVPDFGPHRIGCQGKIDFLFVISSWYSMKANQVQLQEAFPAFTALLEDEFADFDYHIMVVDAGTAPLLPNCFDCYMCIGCQEPGCVEFGGPADYPCDAPLTECDVKEGAGVTITGNFGASNKRCELFGDQRYIVKGEPALEETFQCIATLGEGPKTPVPMRAMRKAIEPAMLYNGGCNDGFLRKDALLAVVVLNGEQDNLSPGTPQQWYDALVAAKKGDEEAIVTLVLSNDKELPDSVCKHEPGVGPEPATPVRGGRGAWALREHLRRELRPRPEGDGGDDPRAVRALDPAVTATRGSARRSTARRCRQTRRRPTRTCTRSRSPARDRPRCRRRCASGSRRAARPRRARRRSTGCRSGRTR
jgi:hypothetical protein